MKYTDFFLLVGGFQCQALSAVYSSEIPTIMRPFKTCFVPTGLTGKASRLRRWKEANSLKALARPVKLPGPGTPSPGRARPGGAAGPGRQF